MFRKRQDVFDPSIYRKVFSFPKLQKTTVAIDDNFVHIFRKGANAALTVGLSGEKSIPISSITSVQLKNPGTMTSGYVQFGVLGGLENQGIMNAVRDENSVIFAKKELDQAIDLKRYVEQLIANKNSDSTTIDVADQIRKFAELHDQGILTDEEFDAKKKQLLGL
ncbi:SHOCT domain-containing protein [Sporolactobacillus pectinivorans]|uniref:SHOCT domain-containing protein n=1 Tax=Sporolactobacillus pectinivorans TaxID=1591408 RepID=UPI000C25C6A7|nr:SHOCT domain-containing protein [Sporolactobacillus pectinivorans]